MELRIDFPRLPESKTLDDMKAELDAVLADDGWLLASGREGERGFVELELEDERMNPKYGIMAVKAYLQRAGFDPYTTMELAGVKTKIFE
ncbi:MAG: hypothetical protein HFF05_02840 [Oscillospiraceae bacterium]|nr:hypothetical protein [Oscillospiraceae bacterium]